MSTGIDLAEILESSSALLCGPFGLWTRILCLSFNELQSGRADQGARDFIFNPDNVFFDHICERMEVEPDAMRERIKKLIDQGNTKETTVSMIESSH